MQRPELMGWLISKLSDKLRGDAITPDAADLELQRAIGPLFRNFNNCLTEESYMRKHRFRTNGLLKEGGDVTSQLLKEDGSIAAVFESENGSLYWLPGHIEELRVAKKDFSEERICDDDLQVMYTYFKPGQHLLTSQLAHTVRVCCKLSEA